MKHPEATGATVFVIADARQAWLDAISNELQAGRRLASSVDSADVVLVVLGPGTDADQPKVTSAIQRALERSIHVVPVVVDDASMPTPERLPTSIRNLAHRQALKLPNRESIPGLIARAIASRTGNDSAASRPLEPTIFVSYRRDDSGYWAAALARALMTETHAGEVWFDTGSERAGTDYREQIDAALTACRRVVVVIGPGFLERDGRGHRRIDDDDDLLRAEIRSALIAWKPIHVVLTGGAEMPRAGALPDDIARLSAVDSTSRLSAESEVLPVAREIASSTSGLVDPGTRLRRRLRGASPSDHVLTEWRERRQALERRAKSVVQELGVYGWTVMSERFDQHTFYTLGNDAHPKQRFVVDAGEAELLLQESAPSARRVGLPQWITRTLFAVSPSSPDTLALQQLPDRLVEAALDPSAYLDRVGRGRLSKRDRKKVMSEHQILRNIDFMDMRPPPDAIEGYQQTLRDSKAQGGLHQLTLGVDAEFSDSALASALAMHPHGPSAAVATDEGIFLLDAPSWSPTQQEPTRSYRSIAFSRTGRLAAGTDSGKVKAWDNDGESLAWGSTPYTLAARARLARTFEGRSLQTLSWSDDGEQLVGAASDAVWLWSASGRDAGAWEFPDHPHKNLARGAVFLPNSDHILVFGMFRHLWVLDSGTMAEIRSLEFQAAPNHIDSVIKRKPRPPPSPSAFPSVNALSVAPDGSIAACAGNAGQVALCDLKRMELMTKLVWHEPVIGSMLPVENHVEDVSFSPDGRWLASIGRDRRIVVGSTETWQATHTTRMEGFGYREMLAWLPDSSSVATVDKGRLQIWRL